ncbi:hypothetical protein LAZ67_X000846 [Cordylochernes scorpioides]|uniref:Uncharacterized protein n=1 Tax=Cordylochernes scorpioides TaxID=51811 RepID=A0ABY6LRY8_9ARAC|nr:hypothetical protein LAZ67_X000846 [Cordylochernes scorpioides]
MVLLPVKKIPFEYLRLTSLGVIGAMEKNDDQQFDVVAQVNGLNVRDKANFLAATLRGHVVEVLQMILEQLRQDFNSLIDALESRYGEEHYQKLHVVKFKNRLQDKKESLQDLANNIRRLAILAFPTCPSEIQDYGPTTVYRCHRRP